jgi:hypothetical protein
MRVANVGVYVGEDSPLDGRRMRRRSGGPWACVDVGEAGEVSLYGSPAAMRRLAAALIVAADVADGPAVPARAAADEESRVVVGS